MQWRSALKESKTKFYDQSGSLGYVGIEELRNVCTFRMRELDTKVWPLNRSPSRDEIIDFFATTFVEVMSRARANYEQYCHKNMMRPEPMPEKNTAPTMTPEERQKKLDRWR